MPKWVDQIYHYIFAGFLHAQSYLLDASFIYKLEMLYPGKGYNLIFPWGLIASYNLRRDYNKLELDGCHFKVIFNAYCLFDFYSLSPLKNVIIGAWYSFGSYYLIT